MTRTLFAVLILFAGGCAGNSSPAAVPDAVHGVCGVVRNTCRDVADGVTPQESGGGATMSRRSACRDAARTTAESITLPAARAAALRAVVDAQLKAGCLDDARTTAESITLPAARAAALRVVVDAQLKAGCLDDARTTAESITLPAARAAALRAVVEAQAALF